MKKNKLLRLAAVVLALVLMLSVLPTAFAEENAEEPTGVVEVSKTTEDSDNDGFAFRLTGTSAAGTAVDMTASTDSDGIALFEDVPVGENYTVSESDTVYGYVTPEAQTCAVTEGETTELTFEGKLARVSFKVTVSLVGAAYGDVTAAVAVYGLCER